MDPDIIAAFLAVEDRRFYRHPGVDRRALARAALRRPPRRPRRSPAARPSRCSSPDCSRPSARTWSGKVAQVLWALRLERHLTKQTILEQYLNRVPLGQGAVGVEAAAALYFGASRIRAEPRPGRAARGPRAGAVAATTRWSRRAGPPRGGAPRSTGSAATAYATPLPTAPARAEPLLARRASAGFLAPHFTTLRRSWQRRALPAAPGAWRTSLDLPAPDRARGGGAPHGRDARRPRRQPRGGGGARQRDRRGPRVGRLARLLGRHGGPGGHGRLAPSARLGAQAVSLRARVRSGLHPGDDAARHRPRLPDVHRALSPAEL